MFNLMLLCIDPISLPYLLDLIRSILINLSNKFPSGDLIELSIIPYSLLLVPFSYLDSGVLPFASIWKMLKDTPNHIPDNMIG